MTVSSPTTQQNETVVLHIITGLGVGGAERVVLALSAAIQTYGCRAIVVSLGGRRGILGQYQGLPHPVIVLNISKRNPWSVIRAFATLIRTATRERVSVVHAHMFHALLAGLICRIAAPRIQLVFTSHSSSLSLVRRCVVSMTKRLRAADVVFNNTQHVSLNAARTDIIPNGIALGAADEGPPLMKDGPRIFLFVGRLEHVKDPVSALRAFASMQNRNCELWLAGDGALLPEMKKFIASSDISPRVKLLGVRGDVPSLLRQADCFLMTSRWEGLPMALLEAGAAGLPVVATPVGAIPEVLSPDCGYLTELAKMPTVLDSVLDNYFEARLVGQRLRSRIRERYSLEQMGRKHAALYRALLVPTLRRG